MKKKLIVRLSGRGQYELAIDDEALLTYLNELDNAIVALLARSESELQGLLGQMTAQVETHGSPLDDVVVESDLILPPTDLTLAETAELFTGEGIIPG